ncbi:MAG: right-handed parallel beta-helix repeat-containing protein [Candidatus Eisenbacteria sp.]|nr:right-handed parallel beta-helix repeat-containing protein [Candidatus Eisenbacteria bacterium]
MKPRICVSAFVILVCLSPWAGGETYSVLPDGTGDYVTIQDAIDASASGDTILLADGTFQGEGNRHISFRGKGIVLRSVSDNPELCIVDCDREGRGFRFDSGETRDAVLRGITITNASYDGLGGGIACRYGSSPTIAMCILTDNQATRGAGLYCGEESAPWIVDCRIAGNRTEMFPTPGTGAGMLCVASEPLLERCIVENNAPGGAVGGIYCSASSVALRECIIRGNLDVGIGCFSSSSLNIDRCTLTGNKWGAIDCYGSSATITSSIIAVNWSPLFSAGVACRNGSSITMRNTVIWGNCGRDYLDQIEVEEGSTVELECCLVDSACMGGEGTIAFIGEQVYSDPLFCDPPPCEEDPTTEGVFSIADISPCLPEYNPCGVLIGWTSVGCSLPPATQDTSWGRLKAAFRNGPED